jgi:hypothetical protein
MTPLWSHRRHSRSNGDTRGTGAAAIGDSAGAAGAAAGAPARDVTGATGVVGAATGRDAGGGACIDSPVSVDQNSLTTSYPDRSRPPMAAMTS